MYRIVNKEVLGPDISLIEIKAPWWLEGEAGQFVILRLWEYGELIPLTIADFDERGTITRPSGGGKTTRQLGTLKQETRISLTVGIPSRIRLPSVVCIGGGVGLSHIPFMPQGCLQRSNRIVGARNRSCYSGKTGCGLPVTGCWCHR